MKRYFYVAIILCTCWLLTSGTNVWADTCSCYVSGYGAGQNGKYTNAQKLSDGCGNNYDSEAWLEGVDDARYWKQQKKRKQYCGNNQSKVDAAQKHRKAEANWCYRQGWNAVMLSSPASVQFDRNQCKYGPKDYSGDFDRGYQHRQRRQSYAPPYPRAGSKPL